MSRIVILPSRDSLTPSELRLEPGDRLVYVEDWFKYHAFDEAFHILEDFDQRVQRSVPVWSSEGISLWRLALLNLYAASVGNLSHLLPFARALSRILKENHATVIFVWPKRDVCVQIAVGMAEKLGQSESLVLVINDEVINPTPREFYGDRELERGSAWKPFIILFITHALLTIGKFLPGKVNLKGQHIIFAGSLNREITNKLLEGNNVIVSSLPPKLLGTIRALKSGRLKDVFDKLKQAVSGKTPHAEDVLRLNLRGSVYLYAKFYRLFRSRRVLIEELKRYLDHCGIPFLPRPYLELVLEDLFQNESFVKFFIYLMLFDRSCGLKSLTAVSGGMTQTTLFELGKKYNVPIFDLSHSVLMHEPFDIHNRADKIVVKGKPDFQRLREEIPTDRLLLIGRPYFDKLYQYFVSPPKKDELDVPDAMREWKSPLLIATEPIRDDHIERVLRQSFKSREADGVCLKLHPKESMQHYKSLMKRIETNAKPFVLVHKEYPLFDLLIASKVMVHISSNVGLEALALGKPAIHVRVPCNILLYYQTLDYFQQFMVTLEELPERIDMFLIHGLDQSTVEDIQRMYLIDGKATDRLISRLYR